MDDAFRHGLATGDAERAAALIQRHGRLLILAGEQEIVTHWIGQLPAAIVRKRPALCLAYAWGLALARLSTGCCPALAGGR
jgi:ATP/maltotriose-dependent transcriptional regulator MalT